LIRLATEKSLQSDMTSLKTNNDYAKSWQQLLIMYQSRHEKRLVWKEKEEDFQKIEQALVEQQKELDEIEEKLPKPLKMKKKKKEKVRITRSKQAVVCVLDLENKTTEPFGNETIEDDEEEEEEKAVVEAPPPPQQMELEAISTSTSTTVINDPFFLNSQHLITYQKRTSQNKNDIERDDKSFIEQSYFVDALSSSSNRRDGGGVMPGKKWAHLTPPTRPRSSNNSTTTNQKPNGIFIFFSKQNFNLFFL
jgi:outer membrane biosynthesis protein TonB